MLCASAQPALCSNWPERIFLMVDFCSTAQHWGIYHRGSGQFAAGVSGLAISPILWYGLAGADGKAVGDNKVAC